MEARLADTRWRSWLWWGIACLLLGGVWLARNPRAKPLTPAVAETGRARERSADIAVEHQASAGTAARLTRTLGVLAMVTAGLFVYSAFR